jgi:hypothetical protein
MIIYQFTQALGIDQPQDKPDLMALARCGLASDTINVTEYSSEYLM